MLHTPFMEWQGRNLWLMGVSVGVAIVTLILGILPCLGFSRRVPYNYFILLIFTLGMAYFVSFLCAISDKYIVLLAAVETLSKV